SGKQALVAIMAANNETGGVHPVREIARVSHRAGAVFLCDLTQSVGKMAAEELIHDIDLGAFSAHKLCGPKGVGALYVRNRSSKSELEVISGGGQEHGMRGGTLNVPGIAGFGEACRIVHAEWREEAVRVGRLRDCLEQTILAELPNAWVNGVPEARISN